MCDIKNCSNKPIGSFAVNVCNEKDLEKQGPPQKKQKRLNLCQRCFDMSKDPQYTFWEKEEFFIKEENK